MEKRDEVSTDAGASVGSFVIDEETHIPQLYFRDQDLFPAACFLLLDSAFGRKQMTDTTKPKPKKGRWRIYVLGGIAAVMGLTRVLAWYSETFSQGY